MQLGSSWLMFLAGIIGLFQSITMGYYFKYTRIASTLMLMANIVTLVYLTAMAFFI